MLPPLEEIDSSVRNRSKQPVAARIGHRVDPGEVAGYLDFVECGFLLPVTIAAGKERNFSGTYMLRGTFQSVFAS